MNAYVVKPPSDNIPNMPINGRFVLPKYENNKG